MNIDRQVGATAPRIEQSPAATARSGTTQGESAGAEGTAPSFASLLTALDPQAPRGPDPHACGPQACEGLPDAVVDTVEQEALLDVAALWAQGPVSAQKSPAQADLVVPGQVDPSILAGLHAVPVLGNLHGRSEAPEAGSELRACGDVLLDKCSGAEVKHSGGPADMALDVDSQGANGGVQGAISRSGRYGNDPGRHLAQGGSPEDGSAGSMRGVGVPVAGENPRSDWRVASAAQLEKLASLAVPVAGDSGGGFRSLPGLRSTERQNGRSVFVPLDGVPAGAGTASAYSTHAMTAAAAAGLPDAPFAPGASAEVAQKVHYWITRGTQNAELQLDAFGGGAVDVSISMQGKEALVEFRSDQPEARRVLQDAMPQLREMLRSEGLALSGGFVGTSAQQDPQARRDGADAAPVRVGTVAVPGQPAERSERPSTSRTHGLDVFV